MRVHLAVLAAAAFLVGQPAHAATDDALRGWRVIATDVVDYTCVTKVTNETQDVKVKVTLTMPTTTTVGSQLTIGWRGVYEGGSTLTAPATGLEEGTKLYAYAGISKYPGLTSATGVGTLDAITPGETIALPTSQVNVLTTPDSAGTGEVRPMAINFGTSPTSPSIKCDVDNRDALTTYTLKVPSTGGGPDPDPDPDATASETPDPDETTEPKETTEPEVERTVTETPSGGVATGAGGEAGPDGRALMVVGFVVVAASAAGLRLRPRRKRP